MSDDRSAALYRAIRVGDYTPHRCNDHDDDKKEPADPLRELQIGDLFYPNLGQPVDAELRDDWNRGHFAEIPLREMQREFARKEAEADGAIPGTSAKASHTHYISKTCGYTPKTQGK